MALAHPCRTAHRATVRRDTLPRRPGAARLVSGLSAALLLGLCASALAQQPFDVTLHDGRLSIRANNATTGQLAEALAAETGVSFVVTGDTDVPITVEIVDAPFAKAIAELWPNYLLVRDGKGRDAPVTEVVVMLDEGVSGGGGGGDTEFLPSGEPADEIAGDDGQLAPEAQQLGDAMRTIIEQQRQSAEGAFDGNGNGNSDGTGYGGGDGSGDGTGYGAGDGAETLPPSDGSGFLEELPLEGGTQ